MNQASRFAVLRARCIAARVKFDENDSALRLKYGAGYRPWWLSSTEQKKSGRVDAVLKKSCRAMYDFVVAISPRDWSSGVPYYWICEDLTYDDAVRPTDQKLSVVPPMSYAATVQMV